MAFSTHYNNSFQHSRRTPNLFGLDQMQGAGAALQGIFTLMRMMQELSQGLTPMLSGSPGFGGAPQGCCRGLPVDGFLGANRPPAHSGSRPSGSQVRPSRRSRPTSGARRPRTAGPRASTRTRRARTLPSENRAPRTSQAAPATPNRGAGGGLGNISVDRLVSVLPRSRQESARTHFPIIIAEARRQGVQSRPQLAYMLATANHESGSGLRMEEIASGRAYEGRRGLGNNQPGDGVRFKGRGYVQITGRRNYTDWSRRLGVDLVGNPRLAEQPDIAAQILVGGMREGTFTGRRLDRYINGNRTDFDGARRTIGGGRGAERVSAVARRLLAAMS